VLKQTPLIEAHRRAGAKLVDFAGWEMPVHYGSQIEEHHQVRRDAGMFDVSHMLAVDVSGARSLDCLRYLLANDTAKLTTPGAALYSCMLNEAGGVLDDLIVYFLGTQRYRLVVNAGTAEKDLAWLAAQSKPFDVGIAPRRDLAIIAVQGPNARTKTWQALPHIRARSETLKSFSAASVDDLFVARTGYTGEDGFEILLPATRAEALWQTLAAQGVKPAGLGARDTLRLEAGMNLYGQDMDENVTPLESGLAWTLALKDDRDFIGKAALTRAQPRRKRVGLLLLDKGVLRAHQIVKTPTGDGEITSGGFSPTMNRSIALARVPRAHETSPRASAAVASDQEAQVIVREQALRARVVDPPFVRNGKILIKES
jgi:aminomethyltransferase